MNILIMGGPGSGKGTMSKKIVDHFHVNHISTGDIFRAEIANRTELGLKAKNYMDQGLLVPDEVTNNMVKSYLETLEDKRNGYLLDGYPRTIDQAKAFDVLSRGTDLAIDRVIVLDIGFHTLAGRITGRRICKGCGAIYHVVNKPSLVEGLCDECGCELYQRKDDTLSSLTIRLDEYQKMTEPVLEYYEQQGIVKHVNADQPIDCVFKDVKKALEE